MDRVTSGNRSKSLTNEWVHSTLAARHKEILRRSREKRPAASIGCEINLRPFERGSIGMAHAGKDTGAARFFISLERQPDLDGKYTCFGRVTSGLPAAERITAEDLIRRIGIREDVTMLDYRRF